MFKTAFLIIDYFLSGSGYTGLGFKAACKQFSKVTVSDSCWSFYFEDPQRYESPRSSACSVGWMMQPLWLSRKDKQEALWTAKKDVAPLQAPGHHSGQKQGIKGKKEDITEYGASWCHFQFEHAVGPRTVPETLSALLKQSSALANFGRHALKKAGQSMGAEKGWTLQCGEVITVVTRSPEMTQRLKAKNSTVHKWLSLESISIQRHSSLHISAEMQLWQYLVVRYVPDHAAVMAFERRMRRAWDRGNEEVCFFFQVDPHTGVPLQNEGIDGVLHAVQPTIIRMPTCMQLSGPFLLSNDRRALQSGRWDKEWNDSVLKQLPKLLLCLLKWVASPRGPAAGLAEKVVLSAYYSLLPKMVPAASGGLCISIVDQLIPLDSFLEDARSEAVVPVKVVCEAAKEAEEAGSSNSSSATLSFVEPERAIWLPTAFLKRLSLPVLTSWFGRHPLAVDELGSSSGIPLWRFLVERPSENLLSAQRSSFDLKKFKKSEAVNISVNALAALGEVRTLGPCV